ncbi:LysM peptidoglycan-binding domain-containing protein [Flavobacterium sp.]|uniref:LysM peptidoglycan-binding domain-containing protein n=1 Tax=Flavobacterium sp. TaxID=239 RepID=UPI002618C9B2|nr:LysM peptidoglycan-binding domain-containing protein [Flavobacterium sp.]
MLNKYLLLIFTLVATGVAAQVDTTEVVIDSVVTDTSGIEMGDNNIITNTSALNLFFEKLRFLEEEKTGHINIVHIGDSHIQADIITGTIRKKLQARFGNGGVGFSFPHRLAKTNGSPYVKYSSNISWDSRRNIYPAEQGMEVGLSGIALKAKESFVVEATVRDTGYCFNTVRIITPHNIPCIDIATSSKTIVMESSEPKKITHKIKSGEVLSIIANKYGTSVSAIKKLNGLRSDNIRAGKTLKIPTSQMEKREIKRSEFIPLPLATDTISNYYYSKEPVSKIYLLPGEGLNEYHLNGLVLEKDTPGILYHSIGVNGAKASDYNKYPLFFEQTETLQPDLIVIALGTNESFDKMEAQAYTEQLNLFIENIRAANPGACLLVMTPPPSLFKRRYPNTFVAAYAKSILTQETDKNYASWDMFSEMGGLYGVDKNAAKGMMSSDRVHYSVQGYQKQGELFTEAFLKAFDNFKSNN